MIETALAYLNLGWCPIPMKPQTQFFKEKKPCIKWKQYQTRLPTEKEIRKWWTKWPDAGIGIVTGSISDILSIDFDGIEAQYKYKEVIGNRPNTISFSSREGHEQDLYKYQIGIKNITGLFKGVDVRGEGGLIVVPPSKHWSGSTYSWGNINPIEDGIEDLINIPEKLLDLMLDIKPVTTPPFSSKKRNTKQKTEMPDWMVELSKGVTDGERNATAARVCGWYLRYYHGDVPMTRIALIGWNSKNTPPLPENELYGVLAKISERHGTEELADKSGVQINRMIFHKAPDGDSKFEIFVNDIKEESIMLIPADLCSNVSFRTKIVGHTGILPNSIPNKEFVPLMQKVLREAEIKLINVTLTHEGFIAEIIEQYILTPSTELYTVNSSFVVIDDDIYFKMNKLKKKIIEMREDLKGSFVIAQCLKNLGFKEKRIRDENKDQHRVWTGSKKKFREKLK